MAEAVVDVVVAEAVRAVVLVADVRVVVVEVVRVITVAVEDTMGVIMVDVMAALVVMAGVVDSDAVMLVFMAVAGDGDIGQQQVSYSSQWLQR